MNPISRIHVGALRMALRLLNFPKPFSFVGPDSALSLCREIAARGVKRLMLITDGPLFKLGVVNPIVEALQKTGVTVEVFSEIEPDPSCELVLKGVECLKSCKAEAVLAVGGGSSIDGAKSIVLCHANDCHPLKLVGLWLGKTRKKGLPFYAIPTTAGMGSEVTIVAVISDKQAQIKYSIIDPKLVPSMVALDPKLMVGLPRYVTGPTGMDALTHAVEAYISTLATDETDELARAATANIVHSLPQAYSNGTDLEVRERMAIASCMAGLAFTRAGVGYVHAIAHQLGGLYHVPHGLANAIVLPHVLDFSAPYCAHRLADLARAGGIGKTGASDGELASDFIARIRKMNSDMQFPETVKELKQEDFDKIIDRAFAEAHGSYGVPRYLSRGDATALLEKLLTK